MYDTAPSPALACWTVSLSARVRHTLSTPHLVFVSYSVATTALVVRNKSLFCWQRKDKEITRKLDQKVTNALKN